MAPRVIIANSNLVGKWANWEHFHELDRKGLMMYGQMTAGSWIYIGTQGILQGTYQTFAALAERHFGGSLAGKLVVTGGMGGMGGAQPLAVTMNGGVLLAIDVDRSRIQRRVDTRYCDTLTDDLDEALTLVRSRRGARSARSPWAWSATAPMCCRNSCAAACSVGCGHRPDQRARSAERLRSAHGRLPISARSVAIRWRLRRTAQARSRRICAALDGIDGGARERHAGAAEGRAR